MSLQTNRQNAVGHSVSINLKSQAFQKPPETSGLPLMKGTAETQGMIITSERKKKKKKVLAHKIPAPQHQQIRPFYNPVP